MWPTQRRSVKKFTPARTAIVQKECRNLWFVPSSPSFASTVLRFIAFVTEPRPIRKILTHLGEPLEPPPVSPARGPPTDWGELVQIHDDRNVFQASPDELPAIDIHKL